MAKWTIVGRIQMVKADKARAVEDLLIRMAQTNQLRSKVTENQLIDLLGQINRQESSATSSSIVVSV
jgi:programmed cell death protein 5